MGRLLDSALTFIQARRKTRGTDVPQIEEVVALSWRGKTEEALAALGHIVNDIDCRFWCRGHLEHPLLLEPLHNEPVFQAMKAEYEAEMAMQLARVREWEAAGELETVSFR